MTVYLRQLRLGFKEVELEFLTAVTVDEGNEVMNFQAIGKEEGLSQLLKMPYREIKLYGFTDDEFVLNKLQDLRDDDVEVCLHLLLDNRLEMKSTPLMFNRLEGLEFEKGFGHKRFLYNLTLNQVFREIDCVESGLLVKNPSGLNITVSIGRYRIGSTVYYITEELSAVLNDDSYNYIYIKSDGTLEIRTNKLKPPNSIKLAEAETVAGVVTALKDKRDLCYQCGEALPSDLSGIDVYAEPCFESGVNIYSKYKSEGGINVYSIIASEGGVLIA